MATSREEVDSLILSRIQVVKSIDADGWEWMFLTESPGMSLPGPRREPFKTFEEAQDDAIAYVRRNHRSYVRSVEDEVRHGRSWRARQAKRRGE